MWLLTVGSDPDVHAPARPQPSERNVFMTEDLVAAAIKAAGDLNRAHADDLARQPPTRSYARGSVLPTGHATSPQ
jgi:hypothetical protein